MKRIFEFFVLLVLVSFGFTFCIKDDLPTPKELGASINIIFPPPPPPEVSPPAPEAYGTDIDQDGNIFKTIEIGDQTWMAENLRTTKYNDGTLIRKEPSWSKWCGLMSGAYCYYNNNEYYQSVYGNFYNGYAVITGKLCPTGWHVPELSEWKTLIAYLGGQDVAAGKLKESGTSHWKFPNEGATNQSGFTALPGGTHASHFCYAYNIVCSIHHNDPDHSIGLTSEWWSATRDTTYLLESLVRLGLFNSYENILCECIGFWCGAWFGKLDNGCYVRCVKDD